MYDSDCHERQRHQDDVGDSGAEKGCHAGDFAAKCAAAVCAEIGYTGIPIIIKSDQEAAMKAVVEDIKRQGLAPNSFIWARATGKINPKSFSHMRDIHLSGYTGAILRDMQPGFTKKLLLDGARLGEPKREKLVALGVNCDHDYVAAWSPPTDHW